MRAHRELVLAALAMALIAAVYAVASRVAGAPAPGRPLGHWLGILGFTLMLATETLYSLRKRALHRPWGRMSEWLQVHIFTGLVGPFLVLLHSAWTFRGLAGVVTLLTGIVVLSGFVGRYIYTALPRTVDGSPVEAEALGLQIAAAEKELHRLTGQPPEPRPAPPSRSVWAVFGRGPAELRRRWQRWRHMRSLPQQTRQQAAQVLELHHRLHELRRQAGTLTTARRLLAAWHALHIPLGMALFVAAFYHIGAALYFATLQR